MPVFKQSRRALIFEKYKFTPYPINIDSSLDKFVPSPITKVQFSYSLFNPTTLSILATGDFENIKGELFLNNKKVHIDITDKKLVNKFKSQLVKGENGWYYETSL